MRAKQLRRLWLRWMAGKDWDVDAELYRQAMSVLFSINVLILNLGREAEAWARKNLAQQLATFSEMSTMGRG